jgi:hypothetical protein
LRHCSPRGGKIFLKKFVTFSVLRSLTYRKNKKRFDLSQGREVSVWRDPEKTGTAAG